MKPMPGVRATYLVKSTEIVRAISEVRSKT